MTTPNLHALCTQLMDELGARLPDVELVLVLRCPLTADAAIGANVSDEDAAEVLADAVEYLDGCCDEEEQHEQHGSN